MLKQNIVKRLLFILVIFLFFTHYTQAQNKASVSGYVIDAKTQEPIPGATVILVGTNLGSITNADGYYTIANANPTTYGIQVSFIGYELIC